VTQLRLMKIMALRNFALVTVFVSVLCPLSAADRWTSLKGLSAVMVIVDNLSPDLERAGITKDQLVIDIQLKLRQDGIKVEDSLLLPRLHVSVHDTYAKSQAIFGYHINLDLLPEVIPLRQPETGVFWAETWAAFSNGLISEGIARTKIREVTSGLVDLFLNDYLAANPK
jgi:hypothetical protein